MSKVQNAFADVTAILDRAPSNARRFFTRPDAGSTVAPGGGDDDRRAGRLARAVAAAGRAIDAYHAAQMESDAVHGGAPVATKNAVHDRCGLAHFEAADAILEVVRISTGSKRAPKTGGLAHLGRFYIVGGGENTNDIPDSWRHDPGFRSISCVPMDHVVLEG